MKDIKSLVAAKYRGLSASELLQLPVHALQGLSERDARLLQESLNIRTIGDLAAHWSVKNAQVIVAGASTQPPTEEDSAEVPLEARAFSMVETPVAAPTYHLSYSSELIQNYQQATVMEADEKFEALQTSNGLSILFSMGSDDVLYATFEQSGQKAAWSRVDLSSAQIKADFPGQEGQIKVETFASTQKKTTQDAITTATIGLAMVVKVPNGDDRLYLSLENSSSDLSWLSSVHWKSFPFDAPNKPSSVVIVGVYLSQTTSGEYIVVDILRDPKATPRLIYRYYLDLKAAVNGKPAWVSHDLAIDLEADRYASALGRTAKQRVDGIYSLGTVEGQQQFIYTPLYNPFNRNVTPRPARLNVPGNLVLDAIAPCRRPDQNTDCFVAAGGGIYLFAYDKQTDSSTSQLLMQNPMFNGITHLYAYTQGDQMVVWGLNGSNQVFYIAAPVANMSDPKSWTNPLPLLAGVNLISPYLNCVNSGNTIFAASGKDLFRLMQSASKLEWTTERIMLPPDSNRTKARAFNSYTTQIQVLDGQNSACRDLPVQLTASSRGGFYINQLYYVLDEKLPITVKTDASGSITIVEAVAGVTARKLQVSLGGEQKLTINPMDKPMSKLADLDSPDKLKNAQIKAPDGSSKNLVASGVGDDDVKAAATGLKNLSTAWGSLQSPNSSAAAVSFAAEMPLEARSLGDEIVVAAGDLWMWLKTGVEHVIEVIKDAATNLWRVVVTIAGKVYHAILDAVEKVAGALEWVFNAIKTGIEDLLKYLSYLFEWQDITRTKDVLKSLIRLYAQDLIDKVDVIEKDFDETIAKAQAAMNNWAGITDWKGLGDAGNKTASSAGSSSQPDVGGGMLANHFKNNAGSIVPNSSREDTSDAGILQPLVDALNKEGQVLQDALQQIYNIVKDFDKLSFVDILKKLVVTLADTILGSTQVVIDALLDLAKLLLSGMMDLLETPIYVPVISDILEYFGVPTISWLDLICYVAAVPATIAYKVAQGAAPFKDDEMTRTLIAAKTSADLTSAVSFASTEMALSPRASDANESTAGGLQKILQDFLSDDAKRAIFTVGHIASGFCTAMLCFFDPFEAWAETGENPFAIPSAVLAAIAGVAGGIADYAGNKFPIKNLFVNLFNTGTLVVRIACKVGFSGVVQKKLAGTRLSFMTAADPRRIGSLVDGILVIPALFCTIWHFVELVSLTPEKAQTVAILEECSNLTAYISRIGYTTAVWIEPADPVTTAAKGIATGVMVVANLGYAGLQVAETMVYLG